MIFRWIVATVLLALAGCRTVTGDSIPCCVDGIPDISAIREIPAVRSPDGNIEVTVSLDQDGRVLYAVEFRGASVVSPSRLGFAFSDERQMVRGFELVGVSGSDHSETWEQPWGERRFVHDHHTELALTFRQATGDQRQMRVRFRAFDDGVAFRYEFPDRDGMVSHVSEELTEFNITDKGTAWWIPGGEWNRYEYLYNETPISEVSTAHTPVTLRTENGLHVVIHEAALIDYSGMRLKRSEGQNFRSDLAPSPGKGKVEVSGAFKTPWRTIQIADRAADLLSSDLILNLNEPNALGDVSWVKPMRYIGIWWGMFLGDFTWSTGEKHGATTANARRYIDFASEHGFDAVLIEGWNPGWDGNWFGNGDEFLFDEAVADFDMDAVSAYAASKGITLIGHHETGGNTVNYEAQMDDAFAYYQSHGVTAVKTGYVADGGGIISRDPDSGEEVLGWHDGQRQVEHELDVVRAAAKYGIAINTHEPVKDTGLRRTYPNWVSREGARGMEYNAFVPPLNPAGHEATLVFTRMLSGPMDFTPGILSLRGAGDNVLASTLAKQLALYVVLYSPLQMAADIPERLAQHPAELSFIASIPVDWDQTIGLDGAVGEFAVIARKDRNSDVWYVGGITDEAERKVTLDLSFLPEGASFTGTLWKDGASADFRSETRHQIESVTLQLTRDSRPQIRMAPGGGFALRLTPEK